MCVHFSPLPFPLRWRFERIKDLPKLSPILILTFRRPIVSKAGGFLLKIGSNINQRWFTATGKE
jgi:hypothetical protein